VNDIFIKVYLDEDVNVLVAEIIYSRNFEALTVSEAGRKGKSDAEQLEFAINGKYAILTHNRVDYEDLAKEYFESGRNHCGIIIAVRRSPNKIAERLLEILNDFTADELKNQIIYI
jgi:predicted nuclease of predicted toxin-antitoxin system